MRTANGRYEIEREHKGVVKTYTTSYTRERDMEPGAWFLSLSWSQAGQEERGCSAQVYTLVGELGEGVRAEEKGKYRACVREDERGQVMDCDDLADEDFAAFATEEQAVAWVETQLGLRGMKAQ